MYARQTCTILLQSDAWTKATGSRGGIAPTHTPEQEEPAGTALYNSPTTFSISSNPRCCHTHLAGAAQSSQLKATLTPKKPCTQFGDLTKWAGAMLPEQEVLTSCVCGGASTEKPQRFLSGNAVSKQAQKLRHQKLLSLHEPFSADVTTP